MDIFSSSDPFAEYPIGEYIVSSNAWNIGVIPVDQPYRQEMTVKTESPISVVFDWSWPIGKNEVKSYPCITFGWNPWHSKSTTVRLPKKIADLKPITAVFDALIVAPEGNYNLAFDLWVTSEITPTKDTITEEVMIWLYDNPETDLSSLEAHGLVVVNGREYNLYRNQYITASRFWLFKSVQPQTDGTLSIHEFLKCLSILGLISPDHYLADIEFGSEIISGTGTTAITNYAVQYKENTMDILTELQSLLAAVTEKLTALHTQSDTQAAAILAAQTTKSQADASIITYEQVQAKCQEMIALLS